MALNKDEEGKVNIRFDFSQNAPKIIEGVVCPLCGGAVEEKSFGYGCANYDSANPNSCRFSIGKIAGKDLNISQVKELLTTGRTGTIRGFTSKNKKKFDACLMLAEDENGVKSLKFDFEHVEAKKVRNVVCPLCGGEIVQTPFGYGCTHYDRTREDSCRFSIGKIAGVKLKEAQVKELLLHKKTEVITGFKSKTGKKFDAALKLEEDGRVAFDFPKRPEPEATSLMCQKCGRPIVKSQWYYECTCGLRITRRLAKVELSEDVIKELLEEGRTKEKITGFISKAGNPFEAYLKYGGDGLQFEFENSAPQNTNAAYDRNFLHSNEAQSRIILQNQESIQNEGIEDVQNQ